MNRRGLFGWAVGGLAALCGLGKVRAKGFVIHGEQEVRVLRVPVQSIVMVGVKNLRLSEGDVEHLRREFEKTYFGPGGESNQGSMISRSIRGRKS